jgi:hypothetical protein
MDTLIPTNDRLVVHENWTACSDEMLVSAAKMGISVPSIRSVSDIPREPCERSTPLQRTGKTQRMHSRMLS